MTDQSNSDPFGGGSLSPDIWHNLLAFGLSTMAAGAKPGATTLGALGQGGVAAMDAARQNAQARSEQQYRGSETAKNNLGNQMQLQGMNVYRQHIGQPPLSVGPGGQIIQSPMQQVGQNLGSQSGAQTPMQQPMDTSQNVAATAPSSQTPSGNQPQESSGMTGPIWASTAGSSRSSDTPQTNTYKTNDPLRPPPGVGPQQWEQSLALSYMQSPVAGEVNKLALAGPTAAATAAAQLPYEIAKGRSGYQMLRGAGDLPSSLYDPMANDGDGGIVAEGAQQGMTPPGQPGAGQHYRLPPNIMGQGQSLPMQPPQSGAPQIPQTLASALNPSTQDPSAGIRIPAPAPPEGLTPPMQQMAQTQQSQGLPYGAILTKMSPQSEELLKQGAADMIEHQRPAYEAAQQTLNGSAVIDANIDKLGNSGWLAPGSGSAGRVEIAKGWQTALSAIGHPELAPDPEKVATAEELNKQTVNLGFNLARTMGARESQMVVEQAIKINPGLGTTYLGGKMVNGLIAENAQRTKDQYEFKMNALNKGIDPLTSETQFNKTYPGTSYVKRAISQFEPVNINTPGAIKNLLPGTVVTFKGMQPKTLPMTPDYQFSFPPTNKQFGGQ